MISAKADPSSSIELLLCLISQSAISGFILNAGHESAHEVEI